MMFRWHAHHAPSRVASGRFLVATLCAAALQACSNSPTSANPATATIAVWQGEDQVDTVGATLPVPLEVEVHDADGAPAQGVTILFTSTAGTLSAASGVSDAYGRTQVNYTMPAAAGSDTVFAAVSGGTAKTYFALIATAGQPVHMAIAGGDQQSGVTSSTLPSLLAVAVTDQFGNPVPNASVSWSTDAGTLSEPVTTTDATGVARVELLLPDTAGAADVTAAVFGATAVTFTEMAD